MDVAREQIHLVIVRFRRVVHGVLRVRRIDSTRGPWGDRATAVGEGIRVGRVLESQAESEVGIADGVFGIESDRIGGLINVPLGRRELISGGIAIRRILPIPPTGAVFITIPEGEYR